MPIHRRPGTEIIRAALEIVRHDGDIKSAAKTLERERGHRTTEVRLLNELAERGAVGAAMTGSADWAGSVSEEIFSTFIDAVAERSILGRAGFIPAPINARVGSMTTAIAAGWRGEAAAIPVREGVFGVEPLAPLSVASLVAFSRELLEFANTDIEELLRRRLIAAAVEAIDSAFIDPTNSGVTDVKPASVLSAPTATTATGALDTDLKALISDFAGDLERATFILHPKTAAACYSILHQTIGLRGGELVGAPAIVSRSCPNDVIALLDADGIAVAMGAPEIAGSAYTDIKLDDDPENSGQVLSGFQHEIASVKLVQRCNWAAVRTGAAAYLDGV